MLEGYNLKSVEFNTMLSNETDRIQRRYQHEICQRCKKQNSIIECDKCEYPICLSCKRFCWICMHKGEKIDVRKLKKEKKEREVDPKKYEGPR